jgi:hypothetical protein
MSAASSAREPVGVPSALMAMSTDRPLLAPGNELEWARINSEEDGQRRAIAGALSPSQRIARGQKLSQQAVRLLAASIRAGNVSRRALWS